MEESPRVFERYSQTAAGRSKGGTGLGLAIAIDIAAAYRGSLDVRSGGGTRVAPLLPLAPSAPRPPRGAAAAKPRS